MINIKKYSIFVPDAEEYVTCHLGDSSDPNRYIGVSMHVEYWDGLLLILESSNWVPPEVKDPATGMVHEQRQEIEKEEWAGRIYDLVIAFIF